MYTCTYTILMVIIGGLTSFGFASLLHHGYQKIVKQKVYLKFPVVPVATATIAIVVGIAIQASMLDDNNRLVLQPCGNDAKVSYLGVEKCQPS